MPMLKLRKTQEGSDAIAYFESFVGGVVAKLAFCEDNVVGSPFSRSSCDTESTDKLGVHVTPQALSATVGYGTSRAYH